MVHSHVRRTAANGLRRDGLAATVTLARARPRSSAWIEQEFPKLKVAGSIPAGVTSAASVPRRAPLAALKTAVEEGIHGLLHIEGLEGGAAMARPLQHIDASLDAGRTQRTH